LLLVWLIEHIESMRNVNFISQKPGYDQAVGKKMIKNYQDCHFSPVIL
jgi:hypothetical protein